MNRNKILQFVFTAAALLVFVVSGMFHAPLSELQDDLQLQTGNELNKSSAELRMIQAMPGFIRIFMINYLWITSEEMKQEEKFYDAEQKTSLICALQPRFPDVWSNRAWNLAYNVSVTAHTSWERWRWINRAIELLRDKGLFYNPNSLKLYLELSWTYFHKLGQITDDLHNDYWSFHAAEFHTVMGSPPRQESIAAYRQWLTAMADAPHSWQELLEDSEVAEFVKILKSRNLDKYICDSQRIIQAYRYIIAYNVYSNDKLVKIVNQPIGEIKTDEQIALSEIMTKEKYSYGRSKILAFCRSLILREKYKLKPDWMLHMLDQYGPMDWRLVWPHSLYWSSYGLFNCKDLSIRYNKLSTTRIINYSLNYLVSYNKATLVYNHEFPEMPQVIMQGDWRMIESCQRAYLDIAEFYNGEKKEKPDPTFQAGHENFLKNAIQTLFVAGQEEQAQKYYDYARKHYGYKNPQLYSFPVDRFAMVTLTKQGISNRQIMANIVNSFIEKAYISLAYGYNEDYVHNMESAKRFWIYWDDATDSDPRKALDPFAEQQARIALQVLYKMPPDCAMIMWEYMPLKAQQYSYDFLISAFADYCTKQNIDINKAFPEPPGMDMIRKEMEKYIQQQNRNRGTKLSEAETGVAAPGQ